MLKNIVLLTKAQQISAETLGSLCFTHRLEEAKPGWFNSTFSTAG